MPIPMSIGSPTEQASRTVVEELLKLYSASPRPAPPIVIEPDARSVYVTPRSRDMRDRITRPSAGMLSTSSVPAGGGLGLGVGLGPGSPPFVTRKTAAPAAPTPARIQPILIVGPFLPSAAGAGGAAAITSFRVSSKNATNAGGNSRVLIVNAGTRRSASLSLAL